MRSLGGGSILIDPFRPIPHKQPLGEKVAREIADLIATQPYVYSARLYEGEPIDFDLDLFRECHEMLFRDHLALSHAAALGVPVDHLDLSNPWLRLSADHRADIVICRTGRRPGDLDWAQLRGYESEILFVGFPHEHEVFCETYGLSVRYQAVADLTELSKIVAGARLVVSDQTLVLDWRKGSKFHAFWRFTKGRLIVCLVRRMDTSN